MKAHLKVPATAMMLAAGLGKRMRPITETIPKPLVRVAGRPLIDWGLDALAMAGITKTVVNVHYLADQLVEHLAKRKAPTIIISDETECLLVFDGGIILALDALVEDPFFDIYDITFLV